MLSLYQALTLFILVWNFKTFANIINAQCKQLVSLVGSLFKR